MSAFGTKEEPPLRFSIQGVLIGFLLATCIASLASAESLYELAVKEGELSYYAQGPQQVYADLVSQFEARYPNVKVRITPGRYDVIEKIKAQLANGGALDADVVTAQTMQDLVDWSRADALADFVPAESEVIPTHLKGRGFFPLSLYLIGLAYNRNEVGDDAAPKSVADFLQLRFRDKIVSTFPHDDDVTLYAYSQIQLKYGWEFFGKLMEQRPQFVRSHVLVAGAVKDGSRPVTFDQISTFNASVFVEPSDVPMVLFPYGIAVFARAKHPNAAKLFVEFSLSKQQQERFVQRKIWSARGDVGPPEGFRPLGSYHVADGFVGFISDRDNVAQLRKRFEAIIGPITGEYIITTPNKARP